MQEFIESLYDIPNFKSYIAIAIAVLVVIFLIVLLTGKKDKKLEETKRLEKLDLDAFKENSEAVKLETVSLSEPKEEDLSNNESILPEKGLISNKLEQLNIFTNDEINIDSFQEEVKVPALKTEEVPDSSVLESISQITNSPVLEPVKEEELQINTPIVVEPIVESENATEPTAEPVFEVELPKIKEVEPTISFESLIPKIKEEIPVEPITPSFIESMNLENASINIEPSPSFEDLSDNKFFESNEVVEKEASNIKFEDVIPSEEIVLPEFNFDSMRAEIKEEIKTPSAINIDEERLEPAKKAVGMPVFSSVYAPKKKDEVIDLTNVSKPVNDEVEQTLNTNSSFDQIMGETYDISR